MLRFAYNTNGASNHRLGDARIASVGFCGGAHQATHVALNLLRRLLPRLIDRGGRPHRPPWRHHDAVGRIRDECTCRCRVLVDERHGRLGRLQDGGSYLVRRGDETSERIDVEEHDGGIDLGGIVQRPLDAATLASPSLTDEVVRMTRDSLPLLAYVWHAHGD